jgi:Cilia- and flagella-associated protein 91
MEQQEMREFSLRESEIDAKREEKLRLLEEALRIRNESSEFFAAQKIEAIRQSKEAQREVAFEKIR